MPPKVTIVCVEAPIAAGKTTLIKCMRGHFSGPVVVVPEPVRKWEASGLFADQYSAIEKGPHENADGMPGMFQVYAFSTRVAEFVPAMERARRLAAQSGREVILLCERSVFSDRDIFKHLLKKAGFITPAQERVYNGCFEAWQTAFGITRPDLIVWLDTPTHECMRRAAVRARQGEVFDAEYNDSLVERHRELFGRATTDDGTPVLRVDGLQPFNSDVDAAARIAREIAAACKL